MAMMIYSTQQLATRRASSIREGHLVAFATATAGQYVAHRVTYHRPYPDSPALGEQYFIVLANGMELFQPERYEMFVVAPPT